MKRAKYENVVGLVALILKHATSFFHRAKYVDLQIWKDKTFGNLNEISYLQVSWLSSKVKKKEYGEKKRYHRMILEANCPGKLERL